MCTLREDILPLKTYHVFDYLFLKPTRLSRVNNKINKTKCRVYDKKNRIDSNQILGFIQTSITDKNINQIPLVNRSVTNMILFDIFRFVDDSFFFIRRLVCDFACDHDNLGGIPAAFTGATRI